MNVKVKCTQCGKNFEKTKGNFNRSIRNYSNHFCNHTCRTYYANEHLTDKQKKDRNICINKHRYSPEDKHSPFKVFTKRARQTDIIVRYGVSDLDVEYLKNIWDLQNGRCGYTGIPMILPKNMGEYNRTHSIKKISLDRIDSSKGYIKGNVHFVCQAINLAKRNLPHSEMISFIREIKNGGAGGNEPRL